MTRILFIRLAYHFPVGRCVGTYHVAKGCEIFIARLVNQACHVLLAWAS